MVRTIRSLSLGFLLIFLASLSLLISDWNRRTGSPQHIPRVAILQHASTPLLEDAVRGMVDGLAKEGFVEGKTITYQRYNSEGDISVSNSIAKEIVAGNFDMALTSSTISMQTLANANRGHKMVQFFGAVADPAAAGIGIDMSKPLDHPANLVGIGSFIPVDRAFQIAREMFPALKIVGVAWNPSEPNSRAFVVKARELCKQLGITLLEANVDNSSAVGEAVSSLASRGAQAIWVGGDVTLAVAMDTVIAAGRRAHIPVFSLIPGKPDRGTLFDAGADFYRVGLQVGELAAQFLHGADPRKMPIENIVPEYLVINELALKGLRDPWHVPAALAARAAILVDKTGIHNRMASEAVASEAMLHAPAGKKFKIGLAYFAPDPGADSCIKGLFDGLGKMGFVKGRNLTVQAAHANGEIPNITPIMQNFDNSDVDLIVAMTTPCLTGACTTVKHKPVVFTYVYDPIAAGAGRTMKDHLPNITGVGSFPPIEETIRAIREIVPGVKSVGTLYNSSEANSRKVISVARPLFRKHRIKLDEIAITNTNEVYQAAQTLASQNIQAIWITGDNTALQAFSGIAKVAALAHLPLIINDPEFTGQGAVLAVGIGWYETGLAAAKRVAQVLLGQNPKDLPFENVAVQKVVINLKVAKQLGITFPPEILKNAEKVGDH
jgi:putative tryptophan/tyrosine transport system substrate-binding protein